MKRKQSGKDDLEKVTGVEEKIREKEFEENVLLSWRLKINVKFCLFSEQFFILFDYLKIRKLEFSRATSY